jgi:hypothetical protein
MTRKRKPAGSPFRLVSQYRCRVYTLEDRDVGSKTTYGIPIICPLVKNWVNIVLKNT